MVMTLQPTPVTTSQMLLRISEIRTEIENHLLQLHDEIIEAASRRDVATAAATIKVHDQLTRALAGLHLGARALEDKQAAERGVKPFRFCDVRARVEDALRARGWLDGVQFYTSEQWALRAESVGADSLLVMTFESAPLYDALNFRPDDEGVEAMHLLNAVFSQYGYRAVMDCSWAIAAYADEGGAR